MKTSLFILSALFSTMAMSQHASRLTYVAITLEQAKGELTNKNFLRIADRSENQFAWEIISLVPYDEWNHTIYTDMFYNGYLDSTKKYYNYFENPADAFQFLADNHWELVTIYAEAYSNGQLVYTRPVYYFKKEIR